jgi:hypothetical protein
MSVSFSPVAGFMLAKVLPEVAGRKPPSMKAAFGRSSPAAMALYSFRVSSPP